MAAGRLIAFFLHKNSAPGGMTFLEENHMSDDLFINALDSFRSQQREESAKNPGKKKIGRRPSRAKMMQTAKLAEVGLNFAGMVHDLRQPLSGIYGFAQLIAEHPKSSSVEEWATEVIHHSLRMQSMINDFRKFLRSGAEDGEAVSWINSSEVIASAVRLIPKLRPGLSISVVIPSAISPQVYADRGALTQIFWNLLLNARDSMTPPTKGGEIPPEYYERGEIQISCRIAPDGSGIFSVLDQGCGIPEDMREKIFEPFVTTKGIQGTGLGLFICKKLAASMGASLILKTPAAPFRTAFELTFPPEKIRR